MHTFTAYTISTEYAEACTCYRTRPQVGIGDTPAFVEWTKKRPNAPPEKWLTRGVLKIESKYRNKATEITSLKADPCQGGLVKT